MQYLCKLVVRFPEWVPCMGRCNDGKQCLFGFLLSGDTEGKEVACAVCGHLQRVVAKLQSADEDTDLQRMLQDGTMRKCPKCQLLTMKEFGVCNVIQCEQCSIWWNWSTRDTGRSSHELKQKARMHGTLWEPGELDYQRTLERKDPEGFKNLLKRNGVTYNPNYRRGT